jgi:hypothetical protein
MRDQQDALLWSVHIHFSCGVHESPANDRATHTHTHTEGVEQPVHVFGLV